MQLATFSHTGGPKRLDLVGQRFGMLVVIEKMPSDKISSKFKCKCDCGNEKVLVGYELNRGNWKSCGCNRTPRTTYEYRCHPLYDVWKGMKARCRNKNHESYSIYGGAGVVVCDIWQKDFKAFYDWCMSNGWEEGLEIDKDIIPKRLGIPAVLYSPEMCSIVTKADNQRIKKSSKLSADMVNEIRQSKLKISELASVYNVNKTTITKIIKNRIWK